MSNIIDLRKEDKSSEDHLAEPEIHQPLKTGPSFLKKVLVNILEIVKIVVISLVIIIPIRMYVIQPFIVEGDSMVPNFYHGEYLIVDEISYRFNEPKRGDVVILHPPQEPKTYYIKRIIGLPGEGIELKDGNIYIYNEDFPDGIRLIEADYLIKSKVNEQGQTELADGEYYVVGDNRNNSLDSRKFGPIKMSNIKGRAMLRAFPFNKMEIFKSQEYIFRS